MHHFHSPGAIIASKFYSDSDRHADKSMNIPVFATVECIILRVFSME
jgi:hypothetical protein